LLLPKQASYLAIQMQHCASLQLLFFTKKLHNGHPISQHGTTSIPNEKSQEIDEISCMNLMNLRTYMLIAKKDFVSHINHKI
jgi:hypothetical protein